MSHNSPYARYNTATAATRRQMTLPRFIILATGLLPVTAIHTTYLLSAWQGHVPWCVPYWDSCASISATGRHGAAFYVFKAMMIPAAVMLIAYWYLAAQWLRLHADSRRAAAVIFTIGAVAAVSLVIYTVALGAAGDAMRLQRRIGVIVFFTFTCMAQMLLLWRVEKLRLNAAGKSALFALCASFLLIGLFSLALNAAIDNYDDYEDAFEWVMAMILNAYFFVSLRLFGGLSARFEIGDG